MADQYSVEFGYPYHAFHFDIQVEVTGPQAGLTNPLCQAAFSECDGLEMTMEPKTYREGGNNAQQVRLVGPVNYGTLTLKRGMTSNLDLWKWFTAVATTAGRGAKANATVRILDPTSTPSAPKVQIKFQLTGCLPIKIKAPALNAKDGQVAIEEMQIAYTSLAISGS
jgi:phage tail-like protein